MPPFMIEGNFAEKLVATPEGAASISMVYYETSVRWLTSFLSADSRKTYYLYKASSSEAIREAARRAEIPSGVIIEVDEKIVPYGTINVQVDRYEDSGRS